MERERKQKTAADKRTTGQSVGNKGGRSYKVPAKAREYIIMQYVCDRKGDKLGGVVVLPSFSLTKCRSVKHEHPGSFLRTSVEL